MSPKPGKYKRQTIAGVVQVLENLEFHKKIFKALEYLKNAKSFSGTVFIHRNLSSVDGRF